MSKSLVLVVGAGASKEVNLPTGAELKHLIASVLNIRYENFRTRVSGDELVSNAIRALSNSNLLSTKKDYNSLLHSARQISAAMPQAPSIDNFIDSHRDDEAVALCSKIAITRCILNTERSSSLYVNSNGGFKIIAFSQVADTWFNGLFQLLTENCSVKDLPERLSRVAIISFNYDRCIEHFLFHSLKNYFNLPDQSAATMLSNLAIYHPYGVVGDLPWQSVQNSIEYGGTPDAEKLLQLSKKLRTFTEGVDPEQSKTDDIRKTLSEAKRMAFLGFSFHRLNIDLLFPSQSQSGTSRDTPVYATAIGQSKSNLKIIGDEIANRTNIRRDVIQLRDDVKCSQLFGEYWRSLSLV